MRSRRTVVGLTASIVLCCAWLGVVSLKAQITGGMLNPSIDAPDEPFSYFWHPTDVIGAPYAPLASEVTPEGYIYTGLGELMFFVGNPLEPVNIRGKTLYKGYLPIVEYQFRRQGVRYAFTSFAVDLGGELEGLPVNFVRVELHNEVHEKRTAFLSSAYRFAAPINGLGGVADYRFQQAGTRGRWETTTNLHLVPVAKKYVEGQDTFNANWKYSFARNGLVRDGKILYLFPTNPQPHQISLALGATGLQAVRYFTGQVKANPDPKYTLDPHTPMGVATYRVSLEPGDTRSLIFKMPIVPIPEGSAAARQIDGADYEECSQKTVSFWDDLVAKSAPLHFPEEKVQHFLLANTIFDLLAVDKVADEYYINVNKFQYHDPYAGVDTAHMAVGMDYMHLPEITGKVLMHFYRAQYPDGKFAVALAGHVGDWYLEAFGYTLWSWARHYLLTRDENFLRQVYPGVVRAMQWQQGMAEKDPLHLMPPYEIADDAFLKDVRQTGQHMWVLIGLRNAVRMAEGMKKSEDAKRFKAQYDLFREAFEKQLSTQTAKSGGYIPPALEGTLEGNDWDNMLTLYPELLFEPFDPRVTATLRRTREKYVEGMLGFVLPRAVAKVDWPGEAGRAGPDATRAEGYVFESNPSLHYWQFPDNAENSLVRGSPEDQELAVKDLYTFLVHTSSTHAPAEFGTYPWSTRDLEGASIGDILPMGASSGKTIELLRNMLVREYKNSLYLFSAISPAWLQPGKTIEVIDEPTEFGPVSAELKVNSESDDWSWEVKLSNQFRQAPAYVVIRVPWFYELVRVEADGKPIKPSNGELVISPDTYEVKVRGTIKPGTPLMSFEHAVGEYKEEYRRRYEEFLRTGIIRP